MSADPPPDAPPLLLVDAFVDDAPEAAGQPPLRGNPAAVVLLAGPPPTAWMRAVAAELNQSETAFAWPHPATPGLPPPPGPEWGLRWFTPRVEVDLCGHATLACAHALWETGRLDPAEPAVFRTRSGLLQAWRLPGPAGEIELDLPAEPEQEVTLTQEVSRAFRLPPLYLGRNRLDLVVELESESAVLSVAPDLAQVEDLDVRGFIVTARAAPGRPYDFVLRYFAPGLGIPEDPVTGSAFCLLGPYWAGRLGRDDLVGRQLSARGGTVRVHTTEGRVRLGGRARTFLHGSLREGPG